MVLKLTHSLPCAAFAFENDVKMYGTQTSQHPIGNTVSFENDVKMYGTQTKISLSRMSRMFENDVKCMVLKQLHAQFCV